MANNSWPSWLETISYPAEGVGDLSDLKFRVGLGEGGQWLGFIHPGWYYADRLEQYHYVVSGRQEIVASPGSGSVTEAVSFRPAWGPIILTGTASGQYTAHHNTFQPAQTVTWTSMGSGYYYTTIPSSSIVTAARDLTILPLGSVSGTGSLIGDKLYYYDINDSKVYIKTNSSPPLNVFLDFLELTPRLRFRESVVQIDGVLYPSYRGIENIDIIRGYQSQTLSGPVTGYITHSLSGVQNGDWVILEYDIQKSFTIPGHNIVHYYTTSSSGDTLTLCYETSLPDVLPSINVNQPVSQKFNLNPLYSSSFRAGYLYHSTITTPLSGYWSIGKVRAYLDKDWVCASWGEPFKAMILVTDNQGLPVPHYPVTISLTAGASSLYKIPTTNTTDGRGEIHFLISVPSSINVLSLSAVASTVTGTASGSVLSTTTTLPSAIFYGGTTELFVGKQMTNKRYPKTYVKAVYLDGIPKPAASITLKSNTSSVLDYREHISSYSITLQSNIGINNIDGIVGLLPGDEIGYLSQPQSSLIALSEDNLSNSKEWRTE